MVAVLLDQNLVGGLASFFNRTIPGKLLIPSFLIGDNYRECMVFRGKGGLRILISTLGFMISPDDSPVEVANGHRPKQNALAQQIR